MVGKNKITFKDLPKPDIKYDRLEGKDLLAQQIAFGYTNEDIKIILEPMAEKGKEPLGSMGTDTPLAVLSDQASIFLIISNNYLHRLRILQ